MDEVELNFIVNAGNVSGELHVDAENNTGHAVTLRSNKCISPIPLKTEFPLSIGRYGSKLGFEREDPAGLWTFSRAYENNANMGNIDEA